MTRTYTIALTSLDDDVTDVTASVTPELVANYSPNIRWGKQIIEIIVMQWEYKATFIQKVGGNCRGLSVIETAIENLSESFLGEEGGPASVKLTRPDGDTLECMDEQERDAGWLKDMIVSARIVGWEPPTLNEVRTKNGAPPIADGDLPYDPL